jgi:hypothetical protein
VAGPEAVKLAIPDINGINAGGQAMKATGVTGASPSAGAELRAVAKRFCIFVSGISYLNG